MARMKYEGFGKLVSRIKTYNMALQHFPEDWSQLLNEDYSEKDLHQLLNLVAKKYQTETCFPPKHELFNAFVRCPLDQVKVVLIGQDPYHGFGQANGLAFSVNDGITFPPSLVNIFKELERDLDIPIPISGNLERWAEQGVLLLNATLSVSEGKAGSHQDIGWETFTDHLIKTLAEEKEHIVFLLWGGFAKKKAKLIPKNKHFILTSGHPSPLSANRGHWFGNRHFSKTNAYLSTLNKEEIEW